MTDKEIAARLRWAVKVYSCSPGECFGCECKAVCKVVPNTEDEYKLLKQQTQRAAADCIERLTAEVATLKGEIGEL